MLNISLLFKKFATFKGKYIENSKIKNAKFSGYCFYMNTNIYGDLSCLLSVNFYRLFYAEHCFYHF